MSIAAWQWAVTKTVSGAAAKAVLAHLAVRANEHHTCWPGIDEIATATQINERTVRRAITELVEAGLIRQLYRYHRKDAGRRSCRYLVMVHGANTPLPPKKDWVNEREPAGVKPLPDTTPGSEGGAVGVMPTGRWASGPVPPIQNPQIEQTGKNPAQTASPQRPEVPVRIETAQTILKAWLDFSGNPPIGSVISRWGREIKRMLIHYPVQKIKNVLARITREAAFSKPFLLERYLIEADCGPTRPTGTVVNRRAARNADNHELIQRFRATEQHAPQAIMPGPPGPRPTMPRGPQPLGDIVASL